MLLRIGNFLNSMISFSKQDSPKNIYARYGVPYTFDLVLIKNRKKIRKEIILKEIESHLSMLTKSIDFVPVIVFSDSFDSDTLQILSETPCYSRIEYGMIFYNITIGDIERINPEIYKELNKK